MIELVLETLQAWPVWWFLAALTLLPLVGMPISPLWVLTGLTYGIWNGLLLILVAMAINFTLAYLLAQRWLRKPALRLFERKGIRIPQAQAGEFVKLTLAVRLLPALPQFLQSYLLGLANVPFPTYFLFSFPPQIAFAVGFVVLGDSLFNLKAGGFILAGCFLLSAVLLLSIARKRQAAKLDLGRNSP
jgi:uncharacterized membrane protein YdjX (TVP38/TMEM64 family)